MAFVERKSDFADDGSFPGNHSVTGGEAILMDGEGLLLDKVGPALKSQGIEPRFSSSLNNVISRVTRNWFGVIVLDVPDSGLDEMMFLDHVTKVDSRLPVIFVSEAGDSSRIVRAIRSGAYDFIHKPISMAGFLKAVQGALKNRGQILEKRGLRAESESPAGKDSSFIGKSAVMKELGKHINRVAAVNADVLIMGETGTGKELVARCLHENSERRKERFVAINCCAIPENILEGELFGHEAGAFTGAHKQRIGKFEYANRGTIYLDEIDSMPLHLQGKLLRVLQERCVERLGSNKCVSVDLRVIASTKMDLKKASQEGRFREDLYYRLNVIHIPLPSLRERREDIPLLFQHFAGKACTRYKRPVPILTGELLAELMTHDWRGNVREIKNAAERFVLGYREKINSHFLGTANKNPHGERKEEMNLAEQMFLIEKSIIEHELSLARGNIKTTCMMLGLPRKTLYDKMRKFALKREEFLERP